MGFRDTLANLVGWGQSTRALTAGDIFLSTEAPIEFYDVGGDNALRISAVYSAVGLIADALSSLTIDCFRKDSNRIRQIDPPRWLDQPDDRISDFDWMHQAATSALLRGNAFGLAFRDQYSRVREVEWQHPSWVSVDETSQWLPKYNVRGQVLFSERTRPGGGVVHVPGFILPGSVQGLSPISLFRHQIETSRSAQQTARDWYSERALPASVLSSKGKLPAGSAEEIQDSIEISPGGIMVLDGTNWEWTPISIPPADMMFLDAIEATANQIAAIFRVDPEDVGGKPNSSLKYSTVEGNQRKLNVRSLLSWVRRFEQGLRPLMDDPTTEFLRFNLDDLARPDAMTRIKIESEQLSNGTLLLDEARVSNGRDPLTPEQVADWQAWYRNKQSAPADLTDQIRAVIADINKKGD